MSWASRLKPQGVVPTSTCSSSSKSSVTSASTLLTDKDVFELSPDLKEGMKKLTIQVQPSVVSLSSEQQVFYNVRGYINRQNNCFSNVILQLLLSTEMFLAMILQILHLEKDLPGKLAPCLKETLQLVKAYHAPSHNAVNEPAKNQTVDPSRTPESLHSKTANAHGEPPHREEPLTPSEKTPNGSTDVAEARQEIGKGAADGGDGVASETCGDGTPAKSKSAKRRERQKNAGLAKRGDLAAGASAIPSTPPSTAEVPAPSGHVPRKGVLCEKTNRTAHPLDKKTGSASTASTETGGGSTTTLRSGSVAVPGLTRLDALYAQLSVIGPLFQKQGVGRQEDAHDFFCFFLEQLHSELVRLAEKGARLHSEASRSRSSQDRDNDEGGRSDDEETKAMDSSWQEIGEKNRVRILRNDVNFDGDGTPISQMFGGKMKIILSKQGSKDSFSTEPFYSLQLSIQEQHVSSLETALDAYLKPTPLQGVKREGTDVLARASHRVTFEALPPVLTVCLKRFFYTNYYDGSGEAIKISKHVCFPPVLRVDSMHLQGKKLFSTSSSPSGESISASSSAAALLPSFSSQVASMVYELTSVVVHIGTKAAGGHYVAFVRRRAGRSRESARRVEEGKEAEEAEEARDGAGAHGYTWVVFDDAKVVMTSIDVVLKQQAYLLVYTRVK